MTEPTLNRCRLLCAGSALALFLGAGVAVAIAETTTAVSSEQPTALGWTPDDLFCGHGAALDEIRRRARSGELGINKVAAPRGVGTMDIGDIAVLEDDGTLVGANNTTDIFNISNAFMATHTDDYDQLVVFCASNFPGGDVQIEAGTAFNASIAAFEAGTNRGQGNPNEGGGITRLRSLLNMNDLNLYPADATTDFEVGGVASGVEILGHEMEHSWSAFVTAQGADILGGGNAHWSFYLHHPGGPGAASPMQGNLWLDQGGGDFTTIESFNGYSHLDEYLLGLRAANQVDPFYVIEFPGGDIFGPDTMLPKLGFSVTGGVRNDLTINDIIANHGVRQPGPTTAPKVFRMAFALVIPQGTSALQADLDKLNAFRTDWISYFSAATEGLGSIDTRLGSNFFAPGGVPFAGVVDFEGGNSFDNAIWEWNQGATISDVGLNEPSGTQSMRINSAWGEGDEIRSRFFDLSGFSILGPGVPVALNYSVQRTGGGNSPDSGHDLLVEYWSNAGGWVVLREFAGTGPDETVFTTFNDALPPDAMHASFRFRFHRLQNGGFPVNHADLDDYFVDDISFTLPASCPGDINGDGVIDTADLGLLLGEFGTAGVVADINGDNVVDTADLGILLGGFATNCP